MSKVFIDTNILVYSLDHVDPIKMQSSKLLLKKIAIAGIGVISTQVLQEFYLASVKKLNADPIFVKSLIKLFSKFEVVEVNTELINEAIDCSMVHKISFWDGLILVSAEAASCDKLLSEDLSDGAKVRGVLIQNPYLNPSF